MTASNIFLGWPTGAPFSRLSPAVTSSAAKKIPPSELLPNQGASFALDALSPKPRTPLLKWAGGKRWLVPALKKLYAPHRTRRLVEPFVGGLAVALGLSPTRALLGDANVHLINFYEWVRKGLVVDIRFENSEEYFYQARERFNQLIAAGEHDSKEAAGLFYYLNRTAFNGLCRFNSKGLFNVPFGKYATIKYITDFQPQAGLLSNWELVSGDFETLSLKPEDFLYVDPPYDVEFTKYSKDDFTWADQERLVEWLMKFPGPTVASNQATGRILKLYQDAGFKVELISAPRRISCTGDRSPATEILAIRNF